MDLALVEAQKAASAGEVPVGAVIVGAGGQVLAAAGNRTLRDYEWCWRARSMGFDVAKAKNVEMVHRLGDSRSKFVGITYKVGAPIRLYYQFRNIFLLSRRAYVPNYWKARCLFFMPIRFFLNSVMQKNRRNRAGFMLKGIYDGLLGRKGPYDQHWK